MRGVTFRRDNPVRTRICLLTPLSGFCPDVYLGERPILGHSCPDLYPEYKRIVRGPEAARWDWGARSLCPYDGAAVCA